jgi:outer membrane protein TolC
MSGERTVNSREIYKHDRSIRPHPTSFRVGRTSRRRPDIRAAEAQLHAATANIGVAVGAFYPSVQLNSTAGFDALDIRNLWKGRSLQYMVGPSVTLPIFAGRQAEEHPRTARCAAAGSGDHVSQDGAAGLA